MFKSSTEAVPEQLNAVPRHIAVIMDGNGRWAKQRFMPRIFGHKRGVDALRETIKACDAMGVEFLTVFAFSSENWRRPVDEVSFLMGLFLRVLESEIERMHANQIRLRIVGNRERFTPDLLALIEQAEASTAGNTGLTLSVAVDYGGRWDVIQATQAMLAERPELAAGFDEGDLAPYLAMNYAPEPDLFIRTGGEQRISNFLLWQLAYTELYFTDMLWPDFGRAALEEAVAWFGGRERRFGRISEQVNPAS
ncbi:undecaprenyl diphosphate synthase [Andreprevotia lacus DSM 23236]|jgi:undecaprenyl diphosphate synthase|uniref:Isoprenyl transferase n=1 Tax=Andreprevotia lacus DSM 23236 TaxID=1121001 RepID=A0A1W1XLA5_9NEIS|nr:polyprenyl diphosphate synthase [Andreprevotia lacus]SMC24750.1 undecaprenyl diphosphate synthase [Andreprevotia lacus DSM 23236]